MNTLTRHIGLTLTVLALALSQAACGSKDDKPAATQVAAKVGSEEISVHQINQVLQRSNATPENAPAMSRAVLEKLIDQQLAVDQATAAKLHRAPDVVAQIEAAKREILARAYLQKVAAALPKPSPEAITSYYTNNPALFSERRVYNLQEIVVTKANATPGAIEQLRALAGQGKQADDIAAALKAQSIVFTGGSATRAAEQLPLEVLARLHNMKDGQSLVFDAPQATTWLHVVSSQQVPLAADVAKPRIEQFLINQQSTETLAAEFKRLRAATTITYMGEFTQPEAAVTAAPAAPQAPTADQTAIDKGVAGLK